MGGPQAPAPMDGASDVPPQGQPPVADPNMGADPSMGGDPNAEGGEIADIGDDHRVRDDEDGMADGNGQLDPGAMDAGMEDGGAEGDPMGGEDDAEGDDSTESIIKQLSPEDREAVRSYAESMLARDETAGDAPEEENGPMMESFVFKKGQLKKIHENLAVNEPEKDDNKMEKKRGKVLSNKSPFKSPKFN